MEGGEGGTADKPTVGYQGAGCAREGGTEVQEAWTTGVRRERSSKEERKTSRIKPRQILEEGA